LGTDEVGRTCFPRDLWRTRFAQCRTVSVGIAVGAGVRWLLAGYRWLDRCVLSRIVDAMLGSLPDPGIALAAFLGPSLSTP